MSEVMKGWQDKWVKGPGDCQRLLGPCRNAPQPPGSFTHRTPEAMDAWLGMYEDWYRDLQVKLTEIDKNPQ